MQKRNRIDEKNTKKPSITNSNELNIETAQELGLEVQNSNVTGKLSRAAYNRTKKSHKTK